ncbi:nitrous oxide reductase accessory protein NosL [Sulfurimonas sp.]
MIMKLLFFVGISIGFIGCSLNSGPKVDDNSNLKVKTSTKKTPKETATKEPTVMKKMFQTVDADKATLVQNGKDKLYCARCGMNLVLFYKTSHIALSGNKKYQYCSLHCLADHLRDGGELRNPEVVDTTSLKFIPVLDAYYVVGSDVVGTMTKVSKYAFFSIDDAKAFQAKHGGVIMDFYGALEEAKKDFQK